MPVRRFDAQIALLFASGDNPSIYSQCRAWFVLTKRHAAVKAEYVHYSIIP